VSTTIGGASPYRIFRHVILPLSRPAFVTTAIFSFIRTWNDFFGQLVYLSDLRDYTVPVALTLLIDSTSESSVGPDVRDVAAVADPGVPVLRGVPADARRGHQHQRAQGMSGVRRDWRDASRSPR
jgi:binding-protein-dependent transport system inner membrane component